MRTISFISANYVARAKNYPGGSVNTWGAYDTATVDAASRETFTAVARDVANAGFEAIDIWSAHCNPTRHKDSDYLEQVKGVCSQFDLAITSYAGGIATPVVDEVDAIFKFVKQLGAPMVAGGLFGVDPAPLLPAIQGICEKYDLRYAMENHPEKSVEEICERIGRGKFDRIGVALDTGWCGTQSLDAVEATKRLREKLFIVHMKDVVAAGGHETCALGEGIVPVEKVAKFLVESNWSGDLGIEHEPFDRNPMPEVKASLGRLKGWLA
jgi:L-ribulose-5-phosphate 3-epimerase